MGDDCQIPELEVIEAYSDFRSAFVSVLDLLIMGLKITLEKSLSHEGDIVTVAPKDRSEFSYSLKLLLLLARQDSFINDKYITK
ncbi:hypothetical protein BUW91_11075 [Priestia megaterium]|nr:hypothetical protein BUW91_11075 [Priestia megaterium]